MITLEQWQTIRHLASIGKSQRFIARTLNISRSAVARALACEEPATYHRTPETLNSLEPLRAVTEAALQRGLSGLRVLELVRGSGYSGSSATFYRWLASVREELARRGSSCRFETGPGEQAQFDWSPYTLQIGAELIEVILYGMTLGYSRRVHWYPSLSERQDSVLEGLEVGWRHFGGACRFVLIDNAKSMVLRHRHSQVRWNDCFLALCGHYRVQPIAATPRHPQTKGKVENPFRLVEGRVLTGGAWRDFNHLASELNDFEPHWEQRIHPSTGVSPGARFEEERDHLLALPNAPFAGCREHLRRLSNDGLVSFQGNLYCVPNDYPLRQVKVRTRQGRQLLVYGLDGKELISHTLNPPGSAPALLPQCYQNHQRRRQACLAGLLSEFRRRYQAAPALVDDYLQHLLSNHSHHPEVTLGLVMDLLSAAPEGVALAAMASAVEFNLPEPDAIEVFLAQQFQHHVNRSINSGLPAPTPLMPAMPEPPPVSLTPAQSHLPALDVERPLAAYAHLLPTTPTTTTPTTTTPTTTTPTTTTPTTTTPDAVSGEDPNT